MPHFRALRRAILAAWLLLIAALTAPGVASAAALVTVDKDPTAAPGDAVQITVTADGQADELSVFRRPGLASDFATSNWSAFDVVEVRRLITSLSPVNRPASPDPITANWCAEDSGLSDVVYCLISKTTPQAKVAATLGDGADSFEVTAGTQPLVVDVDGGPGPDFVGGGDGDDTLTGGAGIDNLFGNGGADTLQAQDGVADGTLSCGGGTDHAVVDGPDVVDVDCETEQRAANPVTLQFAFPTTSRGEGDGSQVLAVTEATPSTGSGSFKLEVVGGTATKGEDYTAAFDGQVVDYESSAIQYSVSMGITDDAKHEGDETVIFKLTSPDGDVQVGTPDTFTVTITDNDPATPGGGEPMTLPPPDPHAGKPVEASAPAPAAVLPRPGLVSKRLPDFTRGGTFLAAPCKSRGYCDVNDVRTYLTSEGLAADITIKTTSSTNDAPNPKKVVLGEVVGSTPRDGDPVSFVPGDRFAMELQVFAPKVPESEQKCKASQKIRAGADTTLGKYLVGKTLEEVKRELLTFECYSRKGADETGVRYAITTTVKPGTRYAEVDKVSDQRIDGSSRTTLVVAMRVPPSELILTVGPDPSKPGLGLALSDGTLTVDPDTKVGLRVRVGLPSTGAPVPAGTEVTLRDPDGQLVDRAVTDAAGEATLTGLIPESKRYEIYASFADRDGDAIAGALQLNAKKRTGSFATLSGVKVSAGAGSSTKAKPLSVPTARRAQGALVPCTGSIPRSKDANIATVQAAAEAFFCAFVRQSNKRDLDAPLARYAVAFPGPTFDRVIAAADKLGPMMTGDLDQAAKEGMTVAFVAAGNPSGELSVKTSPTEKLVATIATDGQSALQIPAAVTPISNGLPAFRDTVNDVTFTIDSRIMIESVSSTISSGRQITGGGALSVSAANFSVFPASSAVAGADGIVAGGAGNIVAGGAGNIVAGGAGNIVAGGAGNIVAGGAGNVIAAGAGNIVAGGAGNIVAGGAGNIVAGGAGNIVAGGAGNIVAGGAGNIVAGGAGNLAAAKLGKAFGAVVNRQGQIVAGGAGN